MKSKLVYWLKTLLPWVIAAALLYYLFKKTPPEKVWASLQLANIPIFFGFGVIYFLAIFSLDNWSLARVLSRFTTPVSFRELLPVRAVSYLLSIVNYNAGQAAIAGFLKKTHQVSFFKSLGAIFFVAILDLLWILLFAFIGSFFLEIELPGFALKSWVRRVAVLALLGFLLNLAFWRGWLASVFRFKVYARLSDWLRGRHLFQAFHHATVGDYFRVALSRLPIHLMILSSLWVVLRMFGVEIRVADLFATVPVIFMLGALPLTPGGLGAVQVATVELLKGQVTSPLITSGTVKVEDLLFSMSLSWMALNYFLKAIFGLIFLRKTSQYLSKTAP